MTVTVTTTTTRVPCADGLTMGLDVVHPAGSREPLPVCVICHGFKGFRRWGMFPPLAERLAASGRAVALFDFSHNGVGDDPEQLTRLDLFREQTLSRCVEDLGAVLDVLGGAELVAACRLQATRRFNVVGHSMGAAVAILRAAEDGRVVQLATLNGVAHLDRFGPDALAELERDGQVVVRNARTGQDLPLGRAWFDDAARLDLEEAATSVFVPGLVVQGESDPGVSVEEGQQLNAWIAGSRLVLVPEADHVFGTRHPFAGWTAALETVARELDAFLPHVGRLGGI